MSVADLRQIRRALISVSDKSGLVGLAQKLHGLGIELISTGGTYKALRDAGLPAREVAELTGFPEMLDGRVKTLHPRVHAGILAVREDPAHVAKLVEHDIATIDLVIVNLYPFEQTVCKGGASHEEIVENIDIGGPTLLRAAAKNYRDVAILTSPAQYESISQELVSQNGSLSGTTREALAAAAFSHVAAYDAAIAQYFARRRQEVFPDVLTVRFDRRMPLRYGENPHQRAAFYVEPDWRAAGVSRATIRHGKELSYNNILDLDCAWRLVQEFAEPASVVIKHNNPCGAATASRLVEAFDLAYAGDPVSAYGGILAFNRPVDEETARAITEPNRFIECILAPSFNEKAFELLTTRPTWKKSVRLLEAGTASPAEGAWLDYRRVEGGLLVQTCDGKSDDWAKARAVTKRQPTPSEEADLRMAWLVCKHVKSNAIVLAKNRQVVGVGAGQMSRVDSVFIAARKAGEKAKGTVLASDAFFPFRDNVDQAAQAGVTAIVQPGGSMRDEESVTACNEHGLAMVFTGFRHFRH